MITVTDDSDEDLADVPASPQDALGVLAKGRGATPEEISSSAGRVLLDLAQVPPQWPRHVQARAIRNILTEVVEGLSDPKQRETARAQLGLTQQYSSQDPEKRIQSLMASGILASTRIGAQSRPAQEWRSIRPALAQMLVTRLSQLNAAGGWEKYAEGYTPLKEDAVGGPFKFTRYHMLFRLQGRVGIECITYRVLQALSDGVDSYRAVAWYYSDPDANVEIIPIANCEVGRLEPLEKGGSAALLNLPHALQKDETCFFASKVVYNSERESTRIVSHEVRSQAVDRLTIGVQFDPAALPSLIWHYTGSKGVGMKRPDGGSSDFLSISELGYTWYEFSNCVNGRRYGIQWDW